ncbi:hypothetical protein WA158_006249 [Blastocystis sp. Blastoise]
MFDTLAGQMRPIKEELSSSNAVLKQKTVIEIRLQYIGQSKDEYYEDMNGKHTIDDIIPSVKNGRAMKCKEYKRFIDSLKVSNYNIIYVIEEIEKQQQRFNNLKVKCISTLYSDNSSLMKRIEVMNNNITLLSKENTIIQCSNNGYINVSTKSENRIIEKFMITDPIDLSDEDNIKEVLPISNSIKEIKSNQIDNSNEKIIFSNQPKIDIANSPSKRKVITDFFSGISNRSDSNKHETDLSVLAAQKLGSLSRFISDGFSSLLTSPTSLIDVIDKLYANLPEKYQLEESIENTSHISNTSPHNDQIAVLDSSSSVFPSTPIYFYPLSTIQIIVEKNIQLFQIINTVINNNEETEKCMISMQEKWRKYVEIHLPELINLMYL